MKKILGVLGAAMIVAAMFFSVNNVNSSNSDTNLASLLSLNSANAECVPDELASLTPTKCLDISQVCVPDPARVLTYPEYGCKWPY